MSSRVLIVVPAYNEATRLPRLLADIAAHVRSDVARSASFDVRFLVVDDGSSESQCEETRRLVEQSGLCDQVRLVRLDRNGGKGAAVRAGFELGLREGHDYLGFIDADGSVAVRELYRVTAHLVACAGRRAGVIGSRVKMLGRRVTVNPIRHYGGRVFATFVAVYFRQPAYDTQCGLKVFARAAVERHLHVPTDSRWVWDTELLLSMLQAGESIEEMPIDWEETGRSKMSLWRDPIVMVWHLATFKRRLRTASHAVPRLGGRV